MDDEQIKANAEKLAADFASAMAAAIKKAGSQKSLAEQTGIHQSRISDYVNANYDFCNLTVGTLIRLFPDLDIIYQQPGDRKGDGSNIVATIEKRLLAMFRRLNDEDKILCFEMMSRSFGGKVEEAAVR